MHPLKKYLQGKSLKEFAAKIESSPAYLCHIMSGLKNPGPEMIKKIIDATDGQITPMELRPDLAEIFNGAGPDAGGRDQG